MEPNHPELSIRKADLPDYHALSAFINTEHQVHRHLDWRSGMDWLGSQPFLLAERDGEVSGVLACPPDPPGIAWVRLFCASDHQARKFIWRRMLEKALDDLRGKPTRFLAAINLNGWFGTLLLNEGFQVAQRIVVLEWMGQIPPAVAVPDTVDLRRMREEDLEQVADVDSRAFADLWQNSLESLHLALRQSAHATVIENEGQIIAYQISTSISINGHLARLAVLPGYQNQHLGYALVRDLLTHFSRINAWRVTVNTQDDNQASLSLYEKTGFRLTGETFDVYRYDL